MKTNSTPPGLSKYSHSATKSHSSKSDRYFFSVILYFSLGFFLLILPTAPAQAGTVCLAETESGKVVKLELTSVGTVGKLQHAKLTISDKDGKEIFSKVYKESAQYADTIHQGKSVVIFSALSGEADVMLTFIGKDEDEYDEARLLSILRNPSRNKAKGNRMIVSIYEDGKEAEFRFKDIIVSVEKDL